MALSPAEQDLYDWAASAVPADLFKADVPHEVWSALAVVLARCKAQAEGWAAATYIVGTTGIWLEAHATDRGTRARLGESPIALQGRLRSYEDALTRSSIEAATQALLDDAGNTDPFYVVELRRERGYLTRNVETTGTGGTFATFDGTTRVFTPDVPFPTPPYLDSYNPVYYTLGVSGAAEAGNNGTFTTTGVSGDGSTYVNVVGVDGYDAAAAWTLRRHARADDVRIGAGGRQDAYLSRGFRMGNSGFIVILPYGSGLVLLSSVREMLRQKKAAGMVAVVEHRLTP